jgi:signal transduction histidine kinase
MPSGGNIKISAAFEKNYLTIVFADNGSGIEPEKVNKISNLYFTSKKKGSGIGLSIVHKIISDHGGNIFVTAVLNEGTSFSIKFPKISA